MQELKRSKSKKVTNLDPKLSRKSIKSDNLHVPLTPSTFRKIKTSASRPSTAKSRSRVDPRKFVEEREPLVRLSHSQPSEVPANFAVHFTSFYQNQDLKSLPHTVPEKPSVPRAPDTLRNFPKMEFTRQMVYKLEHSAGTQHYGRQVSAVLKDTVESPGFDLKLPPVDNCAPFNKTSYDYYPLWYKDPNKMPQISRDQFQEMKKTYHCKKASAKLGKGIRQVEESISVSSETEVEVETETESEGDEIGGYSAETKAHFYRKSSESTISRKNKHNLENTTVDINAKSIPSSSSEHCSSWSSQTSCDTEARDEEEESLDWETEAEEELDIEVEVKLVNNLRKNSASNQA